MSADADFEAELLAQPGAAEAFHRARVRRLVDRSVDAALGLRGELGKAFATVSGEIADRVLADLEQAGYRWLPPGAEQERGDG